MALEDPCASGDWFNYDKMVWGDENAEISTFRHYGSATLQQMDSLVREASDDLFDLQDVSVCEMNTSSRGTTRHQNHA